MKVRAMAHHGGPPHPLDGRPTLGADAIEFDPARTYPVTLGFRRHQPLGTARLVRDPQDGHIWADLQIADPPAGYDWAALGGIGGDDSMVVDQVAVVKANADPRVPPFRDPGALGEEEMALMVRFTGRVRPTEKGTGWFLTLDGLPGGITGEGARPTLPEAQEAAAEIVRQAAAPRWPEPRTYRLDPGLMVRGPLPRYRVEMDGEAVPGLLMRPINADGSDWQALEDQEPLGWELGLDETPIRIGMPTGQIGTMIRITAHAQARALGKPGHAIVRVAPAAKAPPWQVAICDGPHAGAVFDAEVEDVAHALAYAVGCLVRDIGSTSAALLDTQTGSQVALERRGDRIDLSEPLEVPGGHRVTAAIVHQSQPGAVGVQLVGYAAGDTSGNETTIELARESAAQPSE